MSVGPLPPPLQLICEKKGLTEMTMTRAVREGEPTTTGLWCGPAASSPPSTTGMQSRNIINVGLHSFVGCGLSVAREMERWTQRRGGAGRASSMRQGVARRSVVREAGCHERRRGG
jgi:hypothetical protein